MFKKRIILIFFILTTISISLEIEGKNSQKKKVVKIEEKINETLPIPIIQKSFPSLDKSEYLASPKYKLGVCMIGKNFSSMIDKVFCFLNGKHKNNKFTFKACLRTHRYDTLRKMQYAYKVGGVKKLFKKYKMLMIIRNPIDRLISGFMQLCYFRIFLKPSEDYCYGCGKSLSCFINKLQHELWKVSENKMIPNQFYDYHFYPQTWQCNYYRFKDNYSYIKYPSSNKDVFYNNIIEYLRKANVPKNHLKFLSDKIQNSKTEHVTNSRDATKIYRDELFNNTTLINRVCAIFYHDFIEFGYNFPKECNLP